MADGRRSQKRNMPSVDNDTKEYFEKTLKESLKPLATKDSINEILQKFEEKMMEHFEKKFNEQEERIAVLESSLALRQKTVDFLLEKVETRADDNEQYSRRSCLRIHGVEVNNEGGEVIEDVVSECFEKVNSGLDKRAIDRTHRIGVAYTDNESNKQVRSIIVKFKSWGERSAFYRARPTLFSGGKKKPGVLPFRVSLDLTKRRYDLLKHAKELIDNNSKFLYAFADINCSLVVKDANNKHHYFNNKVELHKIVNEM